MLNYVADFESLLESPFVVLLLLFIYLVIYYYYFYFFFSSRRRHTIFDCDWSSDVCSCDLTVWLWDTDLESWLSRACQIVKRNLSQAEWQEALGGDVPYQRTCPDLPPGT